MGSRGPVGKHPDRRLGHAHQAGGHPRHDELPRVAPVVWPEPAEHWHPMARDWFESLPASGQSVDYGQSDVAVAVILAENLSRELHHPAPMSGNALAAFLSGCSDLLCSAGSRRRAGLELAARDERTASAYDAAVADLAECRARQNDGRV